MVSHAAVDTLNSSSNGYASATIRLAPTTGGLMMFKSSILTNVHKSESTPSDNPVPTGKFVEFVRYSFMTSGKIENRASENDRICEYIFAGWSHLHKSNK